MRTDKTHTCKYCGEIFNRSRDLREHVKVCDKHKYIPKDRSKRSKDWVCKICGETFYTKSELSEHRKVTGHRCSTGNQNYEKREYECPYCHKKWVVRKSSYTNHCNHCHDNPDRMDIKTHLIPEDVRKKISESMKKRHQEGVAFSWAKLSKKKEHSYPEKWLIGVLYNELSMVENVDYKTEVSFHTFSLDFLFDENKVIEMDGEQHSRFEYQVNCDKRKDELLKTEGYHELRINWIDCVNNKPEYVKKIIEFIKN